MIKERIALFRKLAILTDATLVCAAFFIAYALRHHLNDGVSGLYPLQSYIVFLPVILLVTGAMLYFFGIYDSFRTKTLWEVLVIVAKSHFSSFVVFSSIVFITQQSHISRAFIGLIFAIAAALIYAEKVGVILAFRAIRRRGFNYKHLLIVGTGRRAQHFINIINEHSSWGFKIVGLIDDDPSLRRGYLRRPAVVAQQNRRYHVPVRSRGPAHPCRGRLLRAQVFPRQAQRT